MPTEFETLRVTIEDTLKQQRDGLLSELEVYRLLLRALADADPRELDDGEGGEG